MAMFRSYGDIERPSASSEPPKETNLYNCDLCSMGWESETDVYIHRNREHEKEIQKLLSQEKAVCLICLTKHLDRDSLRKHMNNDHLLSSDDARRVEREIYICDYCCQIFFNKQMLVVHQAHSHSHSHSARRRRVRIECPKCARLILADTMWSHFQFHQTQSVSCCPICITKCLDREDLKKHLKGHPRHYYCEPCSYQASKISAFYDHVDRHRSTLRTPSAVRAPPPRDECIDRFFVPRVQETWRYLQGLRFKKMSAFKGLTLPGNMRICILCREICTCRKEMKRHIHNHGLTHTADKKKHMCTCGEEFFNRVLLKQHTFKSKDTKRHEALD